MFSFFLERAAEIVAKHKAQYRGVYFMGGGGGIIGDVVEAVSDVAAAATGNAEFIPVINAGETAVEGVASGKSIGKSLEGGAISGAEALAGQEAAGAIGIGTGNDAFNSALGITGDNPAGTGLPNVGGGLSSLFSSSDMASGVPTVGTGATGSGLDPTGAGGVTTTASGSPLAATAAPGGVSASPSTGATISAGQAIGAADQTIGDLSSSTGIEGLSTNTGTNLGDVNGADAATASATTSAGNSGAAAANTGTSGVNSPTAGLTPMSLEADIPASSNNPFGANTSLPDVGAGMQAAANNTATNTGTAELNGISLSEPATSAIGGSSATSGLGSLVPSAKTLEGAALPAGMLAYEAIKGAGALPSASTALTQSGAVTAPLIATETQNLNEANSGQLTASQQQTISNFVSGQQNQLLQQLAQSGVTNPTQDSRYIAGMQQIQEQALALQQQYISAALQAGTAAAGAAAGNLSTVANQQLTQDQEYQQALGQAVGSIGTIVGSSGSPKVTVSTNGS